LDEGYDPDTLKLLYSVSDSEQGQFFNTKGMATAKVEQAGFSFYRACFSEKFIFTFNGEATDTLNIKVLTRITANANNTSAEQQASPLRREKEASTSERMLECLRFPLRENLLKFFDQQEVVQEMKQSKCKLAFKGRWLHNKD